MTVIGVADKGKAAAAAPGRILAVGLTAKRGPPSPNAITAFVTIQITVGLIHIGLGIGRTSLHPDDFADLKVAYWLGVVSIIVGLGTLFGTARRVMVATVAVNIAGFVADVAGIVLYAVDLGDRSIYRYCDWESPDGFKASPRDDDCPFVVHVAENLLTGVDVTMIVLTVLQLFGCVCLIADVFFCPFAGNEDQGDKDGELQPLPGGPVTGPGV